ncbi:MAG: cysteine desulfurase family protein [Polyangia bacterium]
MASRYLDHNATTPLGGAAREAMAAALESFGNPSSIHGRGRAARELVEAARRDVAALVGGAPEGVVFAASGSEAIALGVIGLARRARRLDASRRRVLVGASEHPASLGAVESLRAEGFEVSTIDVDEAGRVSLPALSPDIALVVAQLANHETGVLQPIYELAARARAVGVALFCDAVQAAGKVSLDLPMLGVSALSVAAHKLYGPGGAAAVVLADGHDLDPLVLGGHQERGRRAGTESVAVLVGFGAAAREAKARLADDGARLTALRERLETGLAELGATIFGHAHARLCNTTLLAFDGVSGHLLAIALDLAGFEVSTGAACSSGSVKPSAVLLASGHDAEVARRAVRISLGRDSTLDDVDALLEALPPLVARVRG